MSKYLTDSGATYLVSKIKALYAPISHGTHVTYSTTAPRALAYANTGTATTVARSDHTHGYVPVAGNTTTYPMTGPLFLGNEKYIIGKSSDNTKEGYIIGLAADGSVRIGMPSSSRTATTATYLYGGSTGIVRVQDADLRIMNAYSIRTTGTNLYITHGDAGTTRYINIDSGNLASYMSTAASLADRDLTGNASTSVVFIDENKIKEVYPDRSFHYEFESTYNGTISSSCTNSSDTVYSVLGFRTNTGDSVWYDEYDALLRDNFLSISSDVNKRTSNDGRFVYHRGIIENYGLGIFTDTADGLHEFKVTARGYTTNGQPAHLTVNIWREQTMMLTDTTGANATEDMTGDQIGLTYEEGVTPDTYAAVTMKYECIGRDTLLFTNTQGSDGTILPIYQTTHTTKPIGLVPDDIATETITGSDYYYICDKVGIYLQVSAYVEGGGKLIIDYLNLDMTKVN